MKVQIIRHLMPPGGSYVKDQLSDVALAQDGRSATLSLLFSGWFSDKRHEFSFPAGVLEAAVLTPESVAKVAKAGAFSRGTSSVPGGGIVGLTARLISGSITAARSSSDGAAGLAIVYANEKGARGSFCLVGDAQLVDVLRSMVPSTIMREKPI